jgi:membrane protein
VHRAGVLGRLVGFCCYRAGTQSHLGRTCRDLFAWKRLTIGMVGLVGLLLAFSVLTTSILVAFREMAGRLSPRQIERYTLLASVGSAFWQVLFAAVSYLITVALFVLVYRFMPKAEVTLRDTLPGAFLAGLLWEIAKYVFASSLNYFHYDQIYGSVGAVVAVLTWSYVSSLILLFGAQSPPFSITSILQRRSTRIDADLGF